MRYYVFLLILSLYLSITLLEGLIILGIFYLVRDYFKNRKLQDGKLSLPIILYTFSTLASTLLYYTKRFNKAFEEAVFQLIYFLEVSSEDSKKLLREIPWLFILGFLILLPVEVFFFLKYGHFKPLWGGDFENGFLFTLFGLNFFILSFHKRGILKILCLLGVVISFPIVILSHKRSMILAFFAMFLLILLVLYRSNYLRKNLFWGILVVFFLAGTAGYIYLSKTDYRFKIFNELLLRKRSLDEETLNRILSGRYTLFKEGIEVLKKDIAEGNFLPLLIGHGVRAKEYLTPHSPIPQPRYESFFIFSEFIERGLIGIAGILMIYFIYFKEVLSFRIKEELDAYRLIALLPLGIHLIQSIFTYFWDAMLPVFFLLFKIYEVSKERKS